MTTDWRFNALCAARTPQGENVHDPELFFPIGNSGPAQAQIAEAKAVCHRCPVASQCLTWALDSGQDAGVWGGLSEDERRALKRRTRARATQGSTGSAPRPPHCTDEVAVARQVAHLRVEGIPDESVRLRADERDAAIYELAQQGCGYSRIAEMLNMNTHQVAATLVHQYHRQRLDADQIAERLKLTVTRVSYLLSLPLRRDQRGVA